MPTPEQKKKLLKAKIAVALHSELERVPKAEAFLPFTLAIEHYGDAIFAYFKHRVTAGYTECLNGASKTANRLGRGYSFEVLRAKVLQT